MLFMLDMDDLAYKFLLPQRWRARMEMAGRVQLEDAEASLFARTGAVYATLLSISGPAVIMTIGSGEPSLVAVGNFIIFFPGPLAGLSNCITAAPATDNLRDAAKTVGAAFLGYVCFVAWFTFAASRAE